MEYSLWLIWLPLIGCSSYWLDGVFIGMQASAQMRNSMLLAAFTVFLPVWFLTQELANHGLWLAFYSFLLARSIFMLPAFLSILNKHQLFAGKN
jgi:MATE family multidrug resistance protein